MSSAFRFQDIFARGVQDPYPFYHWLRTEEPVYWNAEVVPAWFISRYDDVVAIMAASGLALKEVRADLGGIGRCLLLGRS